jgi:hypothetical protein
MIFGVLAIMKKADRFLQIVPPPIVEFGCARVPMPRSFPDYHRKIRHSSFALGKGSSAFKGARSG